MGWRCGVSDLQQALSDRKVRTYINYGGGTDSTGMIVELVRRGWLDPGRTRILTADTGSEKPGFYKYLPVFSAWLQARGFGEVSVVRWRRKGPGRVMTSYEKGDFIPLHQWCIDHYTLPSAAFGMKGCSMKWKAHPIDDKVKEMQEFGAKHGIRIVRLFGFDADEAHRHRDADPMGNACRSPLIEWGWGREECAAAIATAGLPQPGKSSCWMCPHMRPKEIAELKRDHPDLYEDALYIERLFVDGGRREFSVWEKMNMEHDSRRGGEVAKGEASSVMGLGRSRAWTSYTDAELAAALERGDDDNARPCGCVDG